MGTLRPEGTAANGTGTLTVSTGFQNDGVIVLTNTNLNGSATIAVTSGTLTNGTGGSITSLAGLGGGSRNISAPVSNQGTLTVGGAVATPIEIPFDPEPPAAPAPPSPQDVKRLDLGPNDA